MSRLFTSGSQRIVASTSASVPSMNSGLISFRMDWLDLLAVQGTSRIYSNSTVQKHQFFSTEPFFMIQLSQPYMTIGKIITLTIWTFVGKVMSLLFNTLSRFITAFLPRSKCLLISWLQSSSAVILEPKKIKSQTCRWHNSYDRKWRGHWRASWWRWKRRVKKLA